MTTDGRAAAAEPSGAIATRLLMTVAGVVALVAAVCSTPVVGAVVFGLVFVQGRAPRVRRFLRFLPGAVLTAAAIWVTFRQVSDPVAIGFDWPVHFDAAIAATWCAVFALLGEAVLQLTEQGRFSRR